MKQKEALLSTNYLSFYHTVIPPLFSKLYLDPSQKIQMTAMYTPNPETEKVGGMFEHYSYSYTVSFKFSSFRIIMVS
jgi:hypothetical protein